MGEGRGPDLQVIIMGPNRGDDFPGTKAEPKWAPEDILRQEVVGKGHHARGPPAEKIWPLPHPPLPRMMET